MIISLTDTCFQIKLIAGFGGWVGYLGYNSGTTTRYLQMVVAYESINYNSSGTITEHGSGTITNVIDPSTQDITTTTTWTNILLAPSPFGFPYTGNGGPTPTSAAPWTYSSSGDTNLTAFYDSTSGGVRTTTNSVVTLSNPYTLAQAEADLDADIATWHPGYAAFDAAAWNTITYVAPHYSSASGSQPFDDSVNYSLAGAGTINTPTAITPNSPYTTDTNGEYSVAWSYLITGTGGISQDFCKCVGWINMAGDYAQKTYEAPPYDPSATAQTACGTVSGAGCGSYFEITPESIATVCYPSPGIQSFRTITPGGHC